MIASIDILALSRFCYSAVTPCEQNNSDPKKQGKAKKPDANLVSGVSPE